MAGLILPYAVDLIIFTVQFALGVLVYGIMARLFFLPRLRLLPRQRALMVLTAPHAFRYLGLYALTQAAYNQEISAQWAHTTAYGDLVTQILAVIALLTLDRGWRIAVVFVWLCNLHGLFALLDSTYWLYSTRLPVHLLSAAWFLPVFYVPLLLWSHIFLFRVLLESRGDRPLTPATHPTTLRN
jgi:hypothetical protein